MHFCFTIIKRRVGCIRPRSDSACDPRLRAACLHGHMPDCLPFCGRTKGGIFLSRLSIEHPGQAQIVLNGLYREMGRRINASSPGLCPVDMALNFLNLCQAQTCGKCVPCRIGLTQLSNMIREVLEGEPEISILRRIENTAQVIVDTADCAIGIDAANMILVGLKGFREDYEEHILHHRCLGYLRNPVPCVALCPAGVDIPGYIALVKEERCADAVRLIRKDNPFPIA